MISVQKSVAKTSGRLPQTGQVVSEHAMRHAPLHPLLELQSTIGNQAVLQLLRSGTIQAKLAINQPGDIYEQEADRIADRVVVSPARPPVVQRKCACGGTPGPTGECEECRKKRLGPQTKLKVNEPGDIYEQEADRVADTVTRMPDDQINPGATVSNRTQISRLQRQCTECEEQVQRQELDENEEEEMVQGKAAEGGENQVPQGVQSRIDSFRGGGQPLPSTLRAYFEPRFGHDFGRVRIHIGTQAAEAARSINAQAFTVGRDVAFAAGQYSPETGAGKGLLAHELTHVIQQNGGTTGWLVGSRQGLSIQRQTGTDYGLALAGSQNKYVAEAVRLWTTKKTMKVEDFVDALMKAIKTDLLSQGVPELKWKTRRGSGVSGSFDSEKWIVNINPDEFSSRKVTIKEVQDLNLDEVTDIVGTLYHESRHTDQDVLIIRMLLDQKKAVKDIVQETKIPERIVNAVKAEKKFKTPPDKAQVAHATRMFAVMYGEHKELLSFLLKESKVVDGVQALVTASSAKDLKTAAPHLKKWAAFSTTVLEPKVKNLNALKTLGAQEAQLKQDLGALIGATPKLVAAFDSASKMKAPTVDDLEDLQNAAKDWQVKLFDAYKNLEGEKDAFAIEELVKQAFKKGATAKPTPAPTKK
jgi:Domain of unknown function (DUF4157)